MMVDNYVVVTVISSHRMRYVVPVSKIEEFEKNNDQYCLDWAEEEVTMEQVKEFSQDWMGEYIIDSQILSEKATLELFDRDNPYLKSWSNEQKLNWIRDYKENPKV